MSLFSSSDSDADRRKRKTKKALEDLANVTELLQRPRFRFLSLPHAKSLFYPSHLVF